MDQEANNQLLKVSWYPITINNSTNNHHENNCIYYVKYLMGETDYRLLITDLRNVWYNAANAQDLYEQASHHRLIIENNQQLRQLLRQVEAFLQDLENNCEIIKEEQSLKIKCSLQQKIGTLSWTFLCELLPSSTGVSSMDAPTVLYNHFILPMFMLIQNQPDLQQDDHSFEKSTQIYPLKQSWLRGIQEVSTSILQNNQNNNEKESSQPHLITTSDGTEPSLKVDVAQRSQVPSPSSSTTDQHTNEEPIIRVRPTPKKRRMFG